MSAYKQISMANSSWLATSSGWTNLMSQTGDSGRSAKRRMKMTEGRRVINGSRCTGITREATRPYLNIIFIFISRGILIISFRNIILIISNDIPIIITRPKPPSGRQGLAGSWGKDTVRQVHYKMFSTSHFAPTALSSNWILLLNVVIKTHL